MSTGLPQKLRDFFGQAVEILGLALPDHENGPAHFAECGLVESITAGVPVQLVPPEFSPVGRLRGAIPRAALVPMPEATVNEDHLTSRTEHEVRAAREVARVKTVAIPQAVYEPTNTHLGLRVLRPDSAHSFATFTNRERVETALPHVEIKAKSRTMAMKNRLVGYPPAFVGRQSSHRGRRSMTLMITCLQWPSATGTPVVNTTPSPA